MNSLPTITEESKKKKNRIDSKENSRHRNSCRLDESHLSAGNMIKKIGGDLTAIDSSSESGIQSIQSQATEECKSGTPDKSDRDQDQGSTPESSSLRVSEEDNEDAMTTPERASSRQCLEKEGAGCSDSTDEARAESNVQESCQPTRTSTSP